jgi:hypothetical protein
MATMAIPDPTSVDFSAIAQWGAGIGLVLGSVIGAAWFAVRNAMKIAARLPAPVTRTETNVITTDSVAMHELAATIEASNTILTENNILRREEHSDREANRRTVQANTDALERSIATINEARSDMRELRREIVVLAERMSK